MTATTTLVAEHRIVFGIFFGSLLLVTVIFTQVTRFFFIPSSESLAKVIVSSPEFKQQIDSNVDQLRQESTRRLQESSHKAAKLLGNIEGTAERFRTRRNVFATKLTELEERTGSVEAELTNLSTLTEGIREDDKIRRELLQQFSSILIQHSDKTRIELGRDLFNIFSPDDESDSATCGGPNQHLCLAEKTCPNQATVVAEITLLASIGGEKAKSAERIKKFLCAVRPPNGTTPTPRTKDDD